MACLVVEITSFAWIGNRAMKPSNLPPKPKEYSLLLLGKPYAVRKKVFDRKEFLLPGAGKNPTRAEAKTLLCTPLSLRWMC